MLDELMPVDTGGRKRDKLEFSMEKFNELHERYGSLQGEGQILRELYNFRNMFRDIELLLGLEDASIRLTPPGDYVEGRYCVQVAAWFTEWEEWDYCGETLEEAINKAALDAVECAEACEQQRHRDQMP